MSEASLLTSVPLIPIATPISEAFKEGVGPLAGPVFAAAVGACLLPWAVFVQYHVGLVEYLKPGLEFSRAEAEATVIRSLPWLDRSGGPVATQINWEVWLFYLFHAMPVIALGIAWWRARRGNERWVGESAGVAAIAVMVTRKLLDSRII